MLSIIFFGTPDIGLESLDYLNESENFDVLAVVTQPDKPSGRGQKLVPSPIKQYALEHDIRVFQPKSIRKEPEIIEEFEIVEIAEEVYVEPENVIVEKRIEARKESLNILRHNHQIYDDICKKNDKNTAKNTRST